MPKRDLRVKKRMAQEVLEGFQELQILKERPASRSMEAAQLHFTLWIFRTYKLPIFGSQKRRRTQENPRLNHEKPLKTMKKNLGKPWKTM